MSLLCRKDGRNWQCSNVPLPGSKYCAKHIGRGRGRKRKTDAGATNTDPSRRNTTSLTKEVNGSKADAETRETSPASNACTQGVGRASKTQRGPKLQQRPASKGVENGDENNNQQHAEQLKKAARGMKRKSKSSNINAGKTKPGGVVTVDSSDGPYRGTQNQKNGNLQTLERVNVDEHAVHNMHNFPMYQLYLPGENGISGDTIQGNKTQKVEDNDEPRGSPAAMPPLPLPNKSAGKASTSAGLPHAAAGRLNNVTMDNASVTGPGTSIILSKAKSHANADTLSEAPGSLRLGLLPGNLQTAGSSGSHLVYQKGVHPFQNSDLEGTAPRGLVAGPTMANLEILMPVQLAAAVGTHTLDAELALHSIVPASDQQGSSFQHSSQRAATGIHLQQHPHASDGHHPSPGQQQPAQDRSLVRNRSYAYHIDDNGNLQHDVPANYLTAHGSRPVNQNE